MNLISTSKLPGKTLGYLAFTGSLALHAGFFALYSSWQWSWDSVPKNQQRIVKVKILPDAKIEKNSPKPILKKTAYFSPAQPMSVSSPSIPTLTARHTPSSENPASLPESWTKPSMASRKLQSKARRIQRTFLSNENIKPQVVRSMEADTRRPESSHGVNVRPSPTLNVSATKSARPTQPAHIHVSGQRKVIQHRQLSQPSDFSNTAATVSRTAISLVSPKNVSDSIHRRPGPSLSKTTIPTPVSPTAQMVTQAFTPSLNPRTRVAALPRKSPQGLPDSHDGLGEDLNVVRGLFAGKVRQQIADAKYYPRIARRRGMEGQPVVTFTLNKAGGVMRADLAQTSGHKLLDQAALDAVHQAAPYPEIPAELKTDTYQFKLPISFILK